MRKMYASMSGKNWFAAQWFKRAPDCGSGWDAQRC